MHLSRSLFAFLALAFVTAAAAQDKPPPSAPRAAASGIEVRWFDRAVRPQDDLFQHVNGGWIAATEIPNDRSAYGVGQELQDRTLEQLRAIVESAADNRDAAPGSDEQRIGDLYASYMNEVRLEQLGLAPLEPALRRIDDLRNKREIAGLMAELEGIGVGVPFEVGVDQDSRASERYAITLAQSGLGMPDRDYYLLTKDAKLAAVRDAYAAHVQRMLALAGDANAAQNAREIVALETRLARVQWTQVANRDPVKTYNKVTLKSLGRVTPGFDWPAWLSRTSIGKRIDYVIIAQPSYFRALGTIIDSTPLPTWKAYFRWRALQSFGRFLDARFVDETFAFEGKALRGTPEIRPRWKRGLQVVESSVGESLGKVYVERHFPPESKARMEKLVANLREAFRLRIDALDWMGPETKREAQAKLAKMTAKIGYPARWRDYSGLLIRRDDLVGNVMRAAAFEYHRNLDKLGKPIDRDEWFMTPQTINAYFNPGMNEVVFPAAYLQPPLFDPAADDAANYGGVGATIGHEMSHAFDDSGSQYDGDGNLRNWWTRADHARFDTRTRALVAQFEAFEPVPGYHINGALTLGENIADASGLEIALHAYRLSLANTPAPVIDGMSGEQRFFLAYAQSWREKIRTEQLVLQLKADTHSPDKFRCNGSVRNVDAFYTAFDVKAGDALYLAPERRVHMW
jgi:predicted metalloendopeptidase